MRRCASVPARQRGVALLAALLVVALAVILIAALLDRGETARARTAHALRAEQTWQLARGMEAWAERVLRDDAQAGAVDSRNDAWAQAMPPIDVPGGRIDGRMRDLGGCFNLNSLADDELRTHPRAVERFERLLRALRLDPGIARRVADWIDADIASEAGGGEDPQYRVARPAYRTANTRMAHASELRLVAGVDDETFDMLAPHVCALPTSAGDINVNTATVPVLMSLRDDITEAVALRLYNDGRADFASAEDFVDAVDAATGRPAQGRGGISGALDAMPVVVRSEYFLAEADILMDGLPFRYSLLLYRPLTGDVRTLGRVRGMW